MNPEVFHGTTILSVRRGNAVALGGDGQVTLGNVVVKSSARKVRIVAIGSGGSFAQAAARALLENTTLAPAEIVKKSLTIAGDLCIYTNQQHTIEELG